MLGSGCTPGDFGAAALLAARMLNLNSVGKHRIWLLLSQAETVLLKPWVCRRVNLVSRQ